MITAVGMHIGELIGGTMIIENIFAGRASGAMRCRRFLTVTIR